MGCMRRVEYGVAREVVVEWEVVVECGVGGGGE